MPDASTSFGFSTDDLPEAARAKVVRELHEHATLPNKGRPEPLEPLRDYRVRLNVTKRVLTWGNHHVRRALRRPSDDPLKGIGVQQRGRSSGRR
jgi:hypothetical protein